MRTFIKTSLAALAIGAVFSLAPAPVSITTPAAAFDRTQGGVIPGSRDDQRFVYGRGWVPNRPQHRNVGRQHRGSSDHNRGVVAIPHPWHTRTYVPTCTREHVLVRGGVTSVWYTPCY